MSVPTRENFQGILQEQLEKIHQLGLRLLSLADRDGLDAICDEFAAERSSVAKCVRTYATRLSAEELIELHEKMIEVLENHLSLIIKSFMERDRLTTLLNRSAFDRRLKDEVERARRYHRQLSLALLDIDRFKSVNDSFGHPAGDRVLLQVGIILQSSLRQSDASFRYGGDEFAAICPETTAEDMEILLSRLEANFKEYCTATEIDHVTGISWGVASLPVDTMDACELIRIADQRLYQRKKEHHLLLTSLEEQKK